LIEKYLFAVDALTAPLQDATAERETDMSSTHSKLGLTIALVSASVLLISGMGGCGVTKSADTLVSEAKQYRQKGDNKAAVIQLKNALEQKPDDFETRYLLGIIYSDLGDTQSAEKEIRKALAFGISPAKALPDLAKVLLMQGKFRIILDEIIPQLQNSPETLSVRGTAYLGLGKSKEARESFDQALKEAPDFPDALIGIAKISLLEKDLQTAERFSEQALAKAPKNADAWVFKGDLLRAQGKSEPALAAYDESLKLNPHNVPARIMKAYLEIDTGKFSAAKADMDAIRKSMPNDLIVFHTQALLDFSQGNHKAALDSLQQALRVAPDHMPSVLLAGAVEYALGSTKQAEQHLKEYLEKDPKNLYARKLLISVLLKNGRTDSALDMLSSALNEAPRDSQLLTLAGESHMQRKNFAKASEYFEEASKLAPKAAMIHTALGMSKLGQGEDIGAAAELEMATNLDGKSTQAAILLVKTQIRLKEYDKALATVKSLEKQLPDNPLVQNLKGTVYAGQKDFPSARASFQKALSLDATYFPAVANLAQLDLQENKPDAARKRFEAILEKDRKNIQAMTALASLASAQGQVKEATDWLERARNENPDAVWPALQLAAHYLRIGEKQRSLDLAQKLQTTNPENTDVLNRLAQIQLATDNKAAALDSYNKLASLMPTSAAVQLRIASVHMAMQNQEAVSEAVKKALALQPDYLEAQVAQATVEARKGNNEQALAIARQIQKQHKLSAGYTLEGDLQMAQNKPALALKAYEQGFSVEKNAGLMIKIYEVLKRTGNTKDADSRISQWQKEHPADIQSRLYLGSAYLVEKQGKAAIAQFEDILKQDPKNVIALNNLAFAYHLEKDSRALEFAERAHKLAPENPAILDTLGWILVDQGNTARGLPLLQKAVSLTPNSMDIRYHLVLGLVKSGDKAKAKQELEQLLAANKTFSNIDDAKALLKQL
jgi:putative PEP-CTERM system TPR-repeat lipoprotein